MNKIEQIKNKKLNMQLSLATLIIAIIGLAIVPLLIRVIPINNALIDYEWYGGKETLFDTYSLIKSQVILGIGILSLLIVIIRQVNFKTYSIKDPVILMVILLATVTFLSQLFSVAPELSSTGMSTRFENTWVWLAYLCIFTLIYGEKWSTDKLKKLGFAFVISNLILSIIGILQYFGIDPVFNAFTSPFISSFKLGNLDYAADYMINYKVIVQTLYHYNYVGFYLSMSIPIIMSFALHDKNWRNRLIYLILLALMFFNLLGSSARGGLVGVAATIPFFILFNRHLLFKNTKVFIALILITIVVFIGFESFTDGFITSRLKSIFTSVEVPNKLQKITLNDDSILFNLDHGELNVDILSKTNDSWEATYTYNDEVIPLVIHESTSYLYLDNDALKDIKIFPVNYGNIKLLAFELYGQPWHFAYDENQTLKYVNPFGKFDTIITPNTFGFEGRERLGSARGYIWSRSLPLIIQKPILGYGIDTFPVIFPQQDYVGKYNAYGTTNMVVDKAHNIYIQVALNSGLLALLSYTALVITSFVKAGKSISKNAFMYQNRWISGTSLSVLSYSVAAFFNDSTVQISSVFWILLALSIGLVKSDLFSE